MNQNYHECISKELDNDNNDKNSKHNEETKQSVMTTERRNKAPNLGMNASSSSITSKRQIELKQSPAVVGPAIHKPKKKLSLNKSKTTKKIEKSKFCPRKSGIFSGSYSLG